MCWCSNTKPEIKTATENLTVYKVGTKKFKFFRSYVTGYLYERYDINPDITLIPHEREFDDFVITQGYHSIASKSKAEIACKKYFYGGYLAEFIIPKGAKYCINDNEEIVSSNIIFIKYINEESNIFKDIILKFKLLFWRNNLSYVLD